MQSKKNIRKQDRIHKVAKSLFGDLSYFQSNDNIRENMHMQYHQFEFCVGIGLYKRYSSFPHKEDYCNSHIAIIDSLPQWVVLGLTNMGERG